MKALTVLDIRSAKVHFSDDLFSPQEENAKAGAIINFFSVRHYPVNRANNARYRGKNSTLGVGDT